MKYLITFAIIISFTGNAFAIVFGGSNFSLGSYPDHSCSKPWSKPSKPFSLDSQFEVDNYNRQVEEYNEAVSRFINCVNEYVDSAQNDIQRITEQANDAINEANSL